MGTQLRTGHRADDVTIAKALAILERRLKARPAFSTPTAVKDFLRLQAQGLSHEVFGVMYLDVQHRLIAYEQLFRGSLSHVSVYSREVVKQVVLKNAASVILHHNHPSGCCEPSLADSNLTVRLQQALELVDVRVLDHVITSDECAVSMAEDSFR